MGSSLGCGTELLCKCVCCVCVVDVTFIYLWVRNVVWLLFTPLLSIIKSQAKLWPLSHHFSQDHEHYMKWAASRCYDTSFVFQETALLTVVQLFKRLCVYVYKNVLADHLHPGIAGLPLFPSREKPRRVLGQEIYLNHKLHFIWTNPFLPIISPQLPEWFRQNITGHLHTHSTGCAEDKSQNYRHCRDTLHFQRPPLQVSTSGCFIPKLPKTYSC